MLCSSSKLFCIPQRYDFSSKSQHRFVCFVLQSVVLYTAKVRFFKQITTQRYLYRWSDWLFCIPQRYDFSSKSQPVSCWSGKGTVVLYTAKVRFFKQITTGTIYEGKCPELFCIPQRYDFSSKSQPAWTTPRWDFGCFVYRKGTIFQANHNLNTDDTAVLAVVLYTAKVRFFKQITTGKGIGMMSSGLFCIPQRYDFSSKSQLICSPRHSCPCCFVYRKGTIFQANHNASE